MTKIEPAALPAWGQRAKQVCLAVCPAFFILWLVGFLMLGIDWVFETTIRQAFVESPFAWLLRGPYYAVIAVLLVAGAIWAAGSLAAGHWKPKT